MDMETYFTEGDLPGEIWKPVVLPERYKSKISAYYVSKSYMVSNMGRVKSTTRKVFVTRGNRKKNFWDYPWYTHLGQLIRPSMMYYVPLNSINNVPIPVLVALAFIPNPNNYKYALPKDGDRSNCCDSNLYWSNSRYTESEKKKVNGAIKEALNRPSVRKKISEAKKGKGVKAVYCVTNNTIYESCKEAGEKLNIPEGSSTVSWACKGKYGSGNGHVYKKLGLEFWYLDEWEGLYGPISK